jgi:phosphoribosylanthranilate isomerase
MLWIKICGLTTAEGVTAAVEAGVDAIGFVFAASQRRVTAEHAATLVRDVPERIKRIAVMQHPAQALVDEVWQVLRPDVLQTDAEDLDELNVPQELQVIPVVRPATAQRALAARILFEGPVSGTGATSDWTMARQLAGRTELILAGGLNAANVVQAIRAVQPFGVDVSSGVEHEPGRKDPRKIHEFVAAARSGVRQ